MRYLILSICHVVGILIVLAPIVAFSLRGVADRLPLAEQLLVGLAVYWCFLPCLLAVTGSLAIDWMSKRIRGKAYFLDSKWPKLRNRVVIVSLLGGAFLYLHFVVFAA